MKFTDHEQRLLLRALDKASAPAEAEKAAHALIASLRARGISGYDILDETAPADTANPGYPTEAWFKKAKEDWYGDHVNRRQDDPPPGDNSPPLQTRVVGAVLKMALLRHRSRIASGTLCVSSVLHKHLRPSLIPLRLRSLSSH